MPLTRYAKRKFVHCFGKTRIDQPTQLMVATNLLEYVRLARSLMAFTAIYRSARERPPCPAGVTVKACCPKQVERVQLPFLAPSIL